MEHRRTARRRAALPLVAGLLLTGCYVDTDYERFPEGKIVRSASLIREWSGDGARLVLREGDAFSASGLKLEYFECASDGIRKKSGDGTWTTIEDSDSTSVLIDFADGCSATLWSGERDGKPVLWATQESDDDMLILK